MADHTGIFFVNRETREVLYLDKGMRALCPEMTVGEKCSVVFGEQNACAACPLDPHLLELEITESAYSENEQSLFTIMENLQCMGFTFSMDDFGSGYSSLNFLKDSKNGECRSLWERKSEQEHHVFTCPV